MADSAGIIELASNAGDFFTNSTLDDVMFRTLYPTQDILIGTSNSQSTLSITSNAVGILKYPAYTLDVNGNINFTGNLTQNGTVFSSGGSSQWSNNSSNVFLFSSNVGIGVSNPAFPLQIITSTYAGLSIGTSGNTNGRVIFGNSNHGIGRGITLSTATDGNDIVLHTAGTGSVVLCPSLTESFRVNSSGNVGIGTSTPGYKLDVSGGVKVSQNGSGGSLRIAPTTNSNESSIGFYTNANLSGSAAGSYWVIGQNSFTGTGVGNLCIGTVSTGAIINITSNANVGIGISNPSAPLQITGRNNNNNPATNGLYIFNSNNSAGNNAIATVRVGGANGGNPYYSLDTNVNGWSIGIDNADSDKLKIISGWDFMATPSWTRMTFDSSGNIGIGTSNSTSPLNISTRSNNNPQTNGLYVFNSNNLAGNHSIISTGVAGTTGGNAYFSAFVSGQPGWAFGIDNADSRKFKIMNTYDFSATTRLTIDSTGNIGIGKTNPSYLLDVAGDIYSSGTLRFPNTGQGLYWGTGFSRIVDDSDLRICTDDTMHFNIGSSSLSLGTEKMYLNSTGLTVSGTASVSGNTTISGSVGIGTSPSYPLHIVNASPVISVGTSGLGSGRLIFGNNNHGIGRGISLSTATDANDIAIHTAGAGSIVLCPNSTEYFRVNSSGNVGINNASPAYRLDVSGTANITGNTTIRGILSMNSQQQNAVIALWGNPATTDTNYYGFGINGGVLRYQVDSSTSDHVFYQTTTELMRIKGSGNVGIGTSSPSQKLHVIGNILASGDITAFSDKRLKTNVKIIDDALTKLHQLNGYTFNTVNTTHNINKITPKHTGLIAQEVLDVLPEVIYKENIGSNNEGYYSIAYGNLLGLVVQAIKELDIKYKNKIDEIHSTYSKQINDIQKQLGTLRC